MQRRVPIGEILVQRGRIDARQLGRALHYQKSWGCRLGKALVTLGFLGEDEVLSVVAQQLDLPYVEVGDREVPIGVLRRVPERLIRKHRVLPLAVSWQGRRGELIAAVSDPHDVAALDEVAFASGMTLRAVLASEADLDQAIARHLDGASRHDALEIEEERGAGSLELVACGNRLGRVEWSRTRRHFH
jgi:hypothetical protein